jgi:GTPase SAR1 family protein
MLEERVTLVAIGSTGSGKSSALNAYLQKQVFISQNPSKSVTNTTSHCESTVDGVIRCGIDTPGRGDSQGKEREQLLEMAKFLQNYQFGVNEFAIVMNGQSPRFDREQQILIRIFHAFFNDPEFWKHVCLVFTRCYAFCDMNQILNIDEFLADVQSVVISCGGYSLETPQILYFFIDSAAWESDEKTINQLNALHNFVASKPPISTRMIVVVDPNYLLVEEEIKTEVFIKEYFEDVPGERATKRV